jgi:hypothetical protein
MYEVLLSPDAQKVYASWSVAEVNIPRDSVLASATLQLIYRV